jgi:hypothetical protein
MWDVSKYFDKSAASTSVLWPTWPRPYVKAQRSTGLFHQFLPSLPVTVVIVHSSDQGPNATGGAPQARSPIARVRTELSFLLPRRTASASPPTAFMHPVARFSSAG